MKIFIIKSNRLIFNVSVIISMLGFHYATNSQVPLWPTTEASWHYTYTNNSMWYGYSHIQLERDTIVEGKESQVYTRTRVGINTVNPNIPDTTTYIESLFIITALEDSVLLTFNFNTEVFDTVIDFKANIGDTWKTYVYNEACTDTETSSYLITEVTNKDIVNVNGENLLKFTLKRVSTGVQDEFLQMFGLENGLFNFNRICFEFSDWAYESALRCFTHTASGYNYINEIAPECEYISTVGITEESKSKFLVYPNLIQNSLQIQWKEGVPAGTFTFTMYDSKGRVVYESKADFSKPVFQIDMQNLVSGLYFLHIVGNNGIRDIHKLIKK